MHVIILGGTGFIGRELIRQMLALGWRVTVPSRSPQRHAGLFDSTPKVDFAPWDARSGSTLAGIIEGADAVVNLVGESIAARRWTPAQKQRIVDSRLRAGAAVLEALRMADKRPGLLVQASAVGLYGPRGDEYIDEDAAPPAPGVSFLADTARAWEASTLEAEQLGLRRVIIRTGMVLDKGGGALEKLVLPFRLFLGGPVGSGKQWMSWIHRKDEAAAVIHLMRGEDCSGAYNLTAPNPVTNLEFCRALGRALRRPCLLPAPAAAVRLALGEMARELVLRGQRVVPKRLQQGGFIFQYEHIDNALKESV